MLRRFLTLVVLVACAKPTPSAVADSSTDEWARAQAVAESSGASGVARWGDDVPYLFQAKGRRGILVHHGAVFTARGPDALATYLRETGMIDAGGPDADGLLHLLYVLEAFPSVPGLAEQGAVDGLGPPDLRPRIEHENGHARVVLHYLMGNNNGPVHGPTPVEREVLDVGPTGSVSWVGERIR